MRLLERKLLAWMQPANLRFVIYRAIKSRYLFFLLPAVLSAQVTFTEVSALHAPSEPFGITKGPDGAIWYTLQFDQIVTRIYGPRRPRLVR
jgi:hypothetical protein